MSVSCGLHIQHYQMEQGRNCPPLSDKPVYQVYSHAKKAHFHEKIQLLFIALLANTSY